ncbi:MAG TPA: hypothetical protein VKF40_27705 [Burkholderiales bacterium]|nr:hypothetical protein [Burkholderiales bacterium]
MPDELYADSISAITITGSVVRIDFVSMGPAADDPNQQPKAVFRQRVVMPVEGFVQSFGTMARVMQQLEQKGLVRRGEAPGKEVEVVATPAAKSSSPNFKPK